MARDERTPVGICGAGPTGLALAAELVRQRAACRIIDKDTGSAAESRATELQVRTLELLDARGLIDRFLAAGQKGHGVSRGEAAYLIRPDGQIGFRCLPFDGPALERHLGGYLRRTEIASAAGRA